MAKPAIKSRSLETLHASQNGSSLPAGPGTYVLVLHLPVAASLTVGKLGEFMFQPGWYLYCGSALGGLRGRIARHLRQDHRTHWHIDYLNSPTAGSTVEAVWWAEGRARRECEWIDAVAELSGASRPVAGFGASDCSCKSHLVYSPTLPSLDVTGS